MIWLKNVGETFTYPQGKIPIEYCEGDALSDQTTTFPEISSGRIGQR